MEKHKYQGKTKEEAISISEVIPKAAPKGTTGAVGKGSGGNPSDLPQDFEHFSLFWLQKNCS